MPPSALQSASFQSAPHPSLTPYIHPLTIGSLRLPNNVLLAPLAGVTDSAFRVQCLRQGAGFAYTEMISAKGMHYNSGPSFALGALDAEETGRCGIQLFGSEPDILAEAVAYFVQNGAVLIDINMGCPMRKVTANGDGSALMREPEKIRRIVQAAAEAAGAVPVTVKMRRGFETGAETAVACAQAAEAGGARAVTVHGRFRDAYYTGRADLGVIRSVREAVRIPVIGNGDVTGIAEAARMFAETGCDAVMIGRGALGNPWIFRTILENAAPPSLAQRFGVLYAQLQDCCVRKGEETAVPEMRKQIAWYLKGLPGAARVRDDVCRARTRAQVTAILEEYFTLLSRNNVL